MKNSRAMWIACLCLMSPGCGVAENTITDTIAAGQETKSELARVDVDSELYRVDDEQAIVAAARAIMNADRNAALITVDADGQPRVRTVYTSGPQEDMTIWIATRPSTRKMAQIRNNPKVALYFNDDAKLSYVSVMGVATLHTDLETKTARNFYDSAQVKEFWPRYPDDFVMIKVTPTWLEVTGHGIAGNPDTWRPQAVQFKP